MILSYSITGIALLGNKTCLWETLSTDESNLAIEMNEIFDEHKINLNLFINLQSDIFGAWNQLKA